AAVLRDRGWISEIVASRTTKHVLDGHLRLELALAHGEATVPVTWVDIPEDEEPFFVATHDQIGMLATIDTTALDALLREVTTEDPAIAQLLEMIAQEAGLPLLRAGLTDPDEAPPLPAEEDVYVRRGDRFRCGEQVISCGSAIDPNDVARLLDGAEPTLLVVDPPYGVELNPTWRDPVYNQLGRAARPYIRMDGHAQADRATEAPRGARRRSVGHRNTTISGDTRADWSEAFELVPSLEVAYVWHATTGIIAVGQGLERIGFELRQQIIWAKTQPVIGRSAYNWQHEPCWYAVRKGKTASWLGPHLDSTLWELASPKQIMAGSTEEKLDHPTQKPIECMARPIRHHAGDVYDPFVGSGTTVVAAQMLGRRCYAMDVDERFVQMAIERWSRYAGREAFLTTDGQDVPLYELRARRTEGSPPRGGPKLGGDRQ
ncbi:MAG: DNA modification methylase, partial [Candidatus Limnocylindrales bacterium]